MWGTTSSDVWTVGGTRSSDPALVMHWDGATWRTLDTRADGVLWAIHGFAGGPVFLAGSNGLILRHDDDGFTVMPTPSDQTVFGLWGTSPDAMWAVGGDARTGGFAWRLVDGAWVAADAMPGAVSDDILFKVEGRAADDVWLVGNGGLMVHWDGVSLRQTDSSSGASLMNLACDSDRCTAVGALGASSVMLEDRGAGWTPIEVPQAPGLISVAVRDGLGLAGCDDLLLVDDGDGWAPAETSIVTSLATLTLHGAWIDPDGGLWGVGGQFLVEPFRSGLMIHRGQSVSDGDRIPPLISSR